MAEPIEVRRRRQARRRLDRVLEVAGGLLGLLDPGGSLGQPQREQFATLTLNTAVELTGAALKRMDVSGTADEQALALRDAMRILFPEAVALVSAARQGFMRET